MSAQPQRNKSKLKQAEGQPYVETLKRASGITEAQAKTCFYYAVATHLLEKVVDLSKAGPEEEALAHIPLLVFLGPHATGKTSLLKQMEKLVWKPKLIGAQSGATLRDELEGAGTALIDEADNADERYLIRRYSRDTAEVVWNESLGDRKWERHRANIFGATVLARRLPFKDPATKSRAITIATRYRPGSYGITEVDKEGIVKLAKRTKGTVTASQRIRDNWAPLQAVASALGDKPWLSYADEEIEKDTRALMAAQSFEPAEALLLVLREEMVRVQADSQCLVEGDVLLSKLKDSLKREFDINLNISQIHQVLEHLGFKLVKPQGYPKVKHDAKLLEKLLAERELEGR